MRPSCPGLPTWPASPDRATGIGGHTPAGRVTNLSGQHTQAVF
jgi:hypothetical protein